MATVHVEHLSKGFGTGAGTVRALQDVSFEVSGHVFVSVVGPSGCGKSTLLNILSGIETPTSGTVAISQDGHDATIGYVFQAARLLPWRTVMDNLLFVQRTRDRATRERCRLFLEMVQLADKADKYPGELSGGMQQRVGISRAFSIEPDLLLMDEPFSHLDAITARELRRELHQMWVATQKTVIFVTHDVGEAVELSNRVVMFGKGGALKDDITIDLSFPRDPADEQVAVSKARILRRFEDLELVAS
ncbi:MAG TPA: ABC transporter ATP-binding protein [Actinomycetota bacterium]|jgi:NitT/TauT family transport system ATP-binding protein|nr:ABC transporter ATP-binding protein [Actinomycetota bacterium]